MRLAKLIKCDAKQKTIKEHQLSEPVNAFVECRIILQGFDGTKTLLLDDNTVHGDLKPIE